MTYEEAIREIEWIKERGFVADKGIIGTERIVRACDMAIEALEKQIPKKHKMVDNVLYCSACESYHGRYGDIRIPVGSKYCPYCSQAILWE